MIDGHEFGTWHSLEEISKLILDSLVNIVIGELCPFEDQQWLEFDAEIDFQEFIVVHYFGHGKLVHVEYFEVEHANECNAVGALLRVRNHADHTGVVLLAALQQVGGVFEHGVQFVLLGPQDFV